MGLLARDPMAWQAEILAEKISFPDWMRKNFTPGPQLARGARCVVLTNGVGSLIGRGVVVDRLPGYVTVRMNRGQEVRDWPEVWVWGEKTEPAPTDIVPVTAMRRIES